MDRAVRRSTMPRAVLALVLVLVLAGCGAGTKTPGPRTLDWDQAGDVTSEALEPHTASPGLPALDRDGAGDVAWEALEPNTTSHDRANWAVVAVRQVSGREVAEEFEGWTFGLCRGPAPPPNGDISSTGRYWFVEMKPLPATPGRPPLSPTDVPSVPEPFMPRALLLIDDSGQVIARMLACVVY